MKKLIQLSFTAVVTLLVVTTISSCKKKFDNPPFFVDPQIVANTKIRDLKAMHTISGNFDAITSDIIVSGIVVADDKSGNFYKQIFIQDETGGLEVQIDATNLYTSYPVGRRVYVKCNGLFLSDYHGQIQLGNEDNTIPGSPASAGIPGPLMKNFVIGGSYNNPVVATVVSNPSILTGSMQDPLQGSLIQLNGYEFSKSDTSRDYADTSSYKNAVNLNIKDCNGNTVIVRSSGYANFAAVHPAQGNGTIKAIYTIYKTSPTSSAFDKQLIIRDLNDVQFYGPRCYIFEEDFGSVGANSATYVSTSGWKNIGEVGGKLYQNAVFGPVKCVKISAFGSGQSTVTSWLISPAITLPAGSTPKLSFTTAVGFQSASTPGFNAYISTNYTGSNTPSTSGWTQLTNQATQIAVPAGSGFTPFLGTGAIDLSAYAGQTVYIAFRYDGSDPTKTATYELDDFKISKN